MNFSAVPHGCLLYVATDLLLFPAGLFRPAICLVNQSFQSCFFFSSSAAKIPVLFGMAKVVIFLTLSSFYLNFFLFVLQSENQILKGQHYYTQLFKSTFSISLSLFPFLRSGMQKQENICFLKTILTKFSIKTANYMVYKPNDLQQGFV